MLKRAFIAVVLSIGVAGESLAQEQSIIPEFSDIEAAPRMYVPDSEPDSRQKQFDRLLDGLIDEYSLTGDAAIELKKSMEAMYFYRGLNGIYNGCSFNGSGYDCPIMYPPPIFQSNIVLEPDCEIGTEDYLDCLRKSSFAILPLICNGIWEYPENAPIDAIRKMVRDGTPPLELQKEDRNKLIQWIFSDRARTRERLGPTKHSSPFQSKEEIEEIEIMAAGDGRVLLIGIIGNIIAHHLIELGGEIYKEYSRPPSIPLDPWIENITEAELDEVLESRQESLKRFDDWYNSGIYGDNPWLMEQLKKSRVLLQGTVDKLKHRKKELEWQREHGESLRPPRGNKPSAVGGSSKKGDRSPSENRENRGDIADAHEVRELLREQREREQRERAERDRLEKERLNKQKDQADKAPTEKQEKGKEEKIEKESPPTPIGPILPRQVIDEGMQQKPTDSGLSSSRTVRPAVYNELMEACGPLASN